MEKTNWREQYALLRQERDQFKSIPIPELFALAKLAVDDEDYDVRDYIFEHFILPHPNVKPNDSAKVLARKADNLRRRGQWQLGLQVLDQVNVRLVTDDSALYDYNTVLSLCRFLGRDFAGAVEASHANLLLPIYTTGDSDNMVEVLETYLALKLVAKQHDNEFLAFMEIFGTRWKQVRDERKRNRANGVWLRFKGEIALHNEYWGTAQGHFGAAFNFAPDMRTKVVLKVLRLYAHLKGGWSDKLLIDDCLSYYLMNEAISQPADILFAEEAYRFVNDRFKHRLWFDRTIRKIRNFRIF